MSEGEALVHFHDWRAHGLVAVPVSIGPATLVLPVGTSPFCMRRLTVAQKFGTGC
jgi:hypothetical protein